LLFHYVFKVILFFQPIRFQASLTQLETIGLVLRKEKTVEDINQAVKRGLKCGHGKVEFELSGIAVQLQAVLKEKR
jgi:predicted sugar kinase